MRLLFFLPVFWFIAFTAHAKEVVVLGTVHGDHNRFPLYNFETLRILIEHIKPDLILIEEDPNDFSKPGWKDIKEEVYHKSRPIEIKKVIMPYAKKYKIKVIPTDSRAEYDKLRKKNKMKSSKIFKDPAKKQKIYAIYQGYDSYFVDDYLFKSVYDMHSDTSMALLEQRLKLMRNDPDLKSQQDIWDRRQADINKNIISALKKEKFGRAIVVYGISHLPPIIRAIIKSDVAKFVKLEASVNSKVPSFFDRNKPVTLP